MDKLKCKHCDHKWFPRNPNTKPKTCASCKSKYWDIDNPPRPGPRRKDATNSKG